MCVKIRITWYHFVCDVKLKFHLPSIHWINQDVLLWSALQCWKCFLLSSGIIWTVCISDFVTLLSPQEHQPQTQNNITSIHDSCFVFFFCESHSQPQPFLEYLHHLLCVCLRACWPVCVHLQHRLENLSVAHCSC